MGYSVVDILDTYGNPMGATYMVTLALDTREGIPLGNLSGTLSKAASSGKATFADIQYDRKETIKLKASITQHPTPTYSNNIVVSHIHKRTHNCALHAKTRAFANAAVIIKLSQWFDQFNCDHGSW